MRSPAVCFYGDDFTGSTDALFNFHRLGLRAMLLTRRQAIPSLDEEFDVLGVAGTARSLPTERIEAEVRPVFEAFRELAPSAVQYKVCSTFDSSPRFGSIGRACEVATEVFGPRPIPVLAAQPEFGRWTVFSTHFGRGQDGAVHRLDRHPTMAHHPITPMREADLRLVLEHQTRRLPVRAVHLPDLDRYADVIAWTPGQAPLVVLDALTDRDLTKIGRLIWPAAEDEPLVAVGSGGLSYALGARLRGETPGLEEPAIPTVGPVLAVSGSCAPQTAIQIGRALEAGWEGLDLLAEGEERVAGRAVDALRRGRSAVVFSSRGERSRGVTSERVGPALGRVVEAAVRESDLRRLIVAGGDTAGQVIGRIDVDGLEIVVQVDVAAPLCRLRSRRPRLHGVEVVLKGGQVGGPDLFEQVRRGRPARPWPESVDPG